MLVWPFGDYDKGLVQKTSESGSKSGVAPKERHAGDPDNIIEGFRYKVTDRDSGRLFENILKRTPAGY